MDNIRTLAGQFKTQLELQDYCNAQYRSLQAAKEQITQLQAEVAHLKELLGTTVPILVPPVEEIIVSDDQAICEMQIQRLKGVAMERDLTLDETKRLDLLMKNLYVAKKHNAQVMDAKSRKLPDELSYEQLVRLASAEEKQNEE